MKKYYVKVDPIIIYPACIKSGKKQDCFNCKLFETKACKSPRGLCTRFYKNHKRGCPNYGKKPDCPPIVPMFDEIFDISKPVYAIFSAYDLESHVNKMEERHPNWSEAQLLNVLYWQGTARKQLKSCIFEFNKEFKKKGYYSTNSPEAMGVDVTKTLKNAGINLEWPARKKVYKIAMAGIPKNKDYLEILK